MLNAVTKLAQNTLGNIKWILCHKIYPNSLGAYQSHYLLDFLKQRLGRFVEQEVGFVKEKYQFRFLRIANFWEVLKQFRQYPQQERRIQLGRIHQRVGGENIDHTSACAVGLHQVVDIEHRLAKEVTAPLLLDLKQ